MALTPLSLLTRNTILCCTTAWLCVAGPSNADDIEPGGKLLLTRGISSVDGSGGGGIVPWALITGNETDRGIGATAHLTSVILPDFDVISYGAGIGLRDRLEFSYTHQALDTGSTGPKLGLPDGYTFSQDIVAMKVRVAGDAIYDQDTWMPQVAIGAVYKQADHGSLLSALGAEDDSGVEFYVSATKLLLAQSLLLGGTLRYTDANQNGLLGFGGTSEASIYPEVSLGYMLSKRLIVGGEYRAKPDNLAFAEEDAWLDLFAAYAINKEMTVSAAYADLGSIATFDEQRGLYLSLQVGF
ncbi:DUF3034 family protein [Hyphomonas chukchiensis]|uniref:DUF3034 family protein n=1 Tax=Hyphomonas chukchiensis TaxID=1280947 RepID=UPI00068C57DA|nr:DUF3034 family protein [Hyphomonas chukchiensis]|tara:strand:+ start:786 stop:1679 length:894 start_codon:yes stop_codon:yes gene_type:complete